MVNTARQLSQELEELREGLRSRPRRIPCKYLYDDVGSALFDRICDLPEYYPTRTELALLEERASDIARLTGARELVELGSGTARKTRTLLEALLAQGRALREGPLRYVPIDISAYALEVTAALPQVLPGLEVRGCLADYTQDLTDVAPGPGALVAFLGSTLGNFAEEGALGLLTALRRRLRLGSWFLLGVDLVKPVAVLEAAYNDSEGVTAAFNRNVLSAVNREVGGDFAPDDFEHLAFFNAAERQIEMHLVARRAVTVRLGRLDLTLAVQAGERIHTEISRKFTRGHVEALLGAAGFALRHWFAAPGDAFGLALAQAVAGPGEPGRGAVGPLHRS